MGRGSAFWASARASIRWRCSSADRTRRIWREAARIGADFGYDEINLNVGCPSDRVQYGRFGACLMREPELVGECVAAMKAAVPVPVTVKCRIGVDDQDPGGGLRPPRRRGRRGGLRRAVVHARKAWLKGLSPKENRDIPPLDYDRVYRLKQARPDLPIAINGGITTMAEVHEHLAHVDGVMLGRAAYHEPELLLAVDRELSARPLRSRTLSRPSRPTSLTSRRSSPKGVRLHTITRHMLGLFTGRPGARAYRRHLATEAMKPGANLQTLRDAVAHVARVEAVPALKAAE